MTLRACCWQHPDFSIWRELLDKMLHVDFRKNSAPCRQSHQHIMYRSHKKQQKICFSHGSSIGIVRTASAAASVPADIDFALLLLLRLRVVASQRKQHHSPQYQRGGYVRPAAAYQLLEGLPAVFCWPWAFFCPTNSSSQRCHLRRFGSALLVIVCLIGFRDFNIRNCFNFCTRLFFLRHAFIY